MTLTNSSSSSSSKSEKSRTFHQLLLSEDRFQLSLKLSRSFSALKVVSTENLKLLMDMCPFVEDDDNYCLMDVRTLSGFIALALTLTESGFQHTEKVTNYVYKLLRAARKASWESPFGVNCRRGINFPEFFGVVVGTVLTDIAVFRPEHSSDIIDAVFTELDYLYKYTTEISSLAVAENQSFVSYYIPFIIGILRTFNRKSSIAVPITVLLFPSQSYPVNEKMRGNDVTTQKGIPVPTTKYSVSSYGVQSSRRLQSIQTEYEDHYANLATAFNTSIVHGAEAAETVLKSRLPHSADPAEPNKCGGGAYELLFFDPVSLFYCFGSSYPLLGSPGPQRRINAGGNQSVQLDKSQLLMARNIVSNLLNEEFLAKLDDGCEFHFYKLQKILPYKSYSEILSLCAISLVKSLLLYHTTRLDEELKGAFYDLVKVQYVLLCSNIDVENKYAAGLKMKNKFSPEVFNAYYLYSKACSETTQVLVKLVEEESSEIVVSKLTTRILKTGYNFTRCYLFELPMYECALNCMGSLAEKFPSSQVAKSVVDRLKNFLLDPSSVLTNIYNLSVNSSFPSSSSDGHRAGRERSTLCGNKKYNDPLTVFSRLRDLAIGNLCRALQAVFRYDPDIINAALATISNKSYSNVAERSRTMAGKTLMVEVEIVSRNCILILGHLALTQKQSFASNADLMSKVLGIFQQMFHRDSTYLDELIVDQMGYMVMVGPAGGGPAWINYNNGNGAGGGTGMNNMDPIGGCSPNSPYNQSSVINPSLWWEDDEYLEDQDSDYASEAATGAGVGGGRMWRQDGNSIDPANNQVYQQIMKIFSTALCGTGAANTSSVSDSVMSSGSGAKQSTSSDPQFSLTTAAATTSLGASLDQTSAAIGHVIPAVLTTLYAMANSLREPQHMTDFLLRLLTLFNNLGMNTILTNQRMAAAKAASEAAVSDAAAAAANKCSSFELLPAIAAILDRQASEAFETNRTVYKAFQQFWFVVSRLKLDNETDIARIARKSPLLVSSDVEQNLKQIVDVDFKFFKDEPLSDMQKMKTLLVNRTRAQGDFALAISKMDSWSQVNFALAVQTLESLRHRHAAVPSFRVLFQYFEELQLIKEGKINNMWSVIKGVCDFVFTKYLETMRGQRRNWRHDNLLREHSQFLLIKFNDPTQEIRKQADHYLSQLLNEFSNILWNYQFIKTCLGILEIQSRHLDQRQEGISLKIPVPGTSLELVLARTVEDRRAILSDFTERSKFFIKTAVSIASNTTRSHLMHYIDTKDDSSRGYSTHPGWNLAMEVLVNNSRSEGSNLALSASQDQGSLASFMPLRSKYLGEARGSIQSLKEMGIPVKDLQQKCVKTLLCSQNTDAIFLEAVFKMSAMVIMCEDGCDVSYMLKAVCSGFLNHFTEQGVNNSIACWEWIISARNDLTLQLFMYICEAWHSSKDRKLGIFSEEVGVVSPAALTRGHENQSSAPLVTPHNLLVQFFEQKFATFKFNDYDILDMMYHLIGQTLNRESLIRHPNFSLEVKPIMNRSLSAVCVRFRILVLASRLLQFKVPAKNDDTDPVFDSESDRASQIVYLKRILNGAFEYFTLTALPPTQSRETLREDISVLTDFLLWLRREKVSTGQQLNVKKKQRLNYSNVPDLKHELKALYGKLTLLTLLVWVEIERLTIWFSPLKLPLDDPKFKEWTNLLNKMGSLISQSQQDRFWTEYTEIAWQICPDLAIHLPSRFKNHPAIIRELRKLVRNFPQFVTHIPQAVDYLCSDMADADSVEVMPVLTWKYGSPCAALKLLYSTRSSYTAQYAVRMLQLYPEEVLIFFVPQLVQSLRYDVLGYVKEFILWASKKYVILAHQFIWNMETNAFKDEDKNQPDEKIGELCPLLVSQIKQNFTKEQADMYRKEFDFFAEVTSISGKIRLFEKGPKRKKECQRLLKNIEVGGERKGCYLPTDPDAEVVAIDYTSGIPMQSAAKAPFLAKFFVQKVQRISSSSSPISSITSNVAERSGSLTSHVSSGTTRNSVKSYESNVGSQIINNVNSGSTYVQGCIFKVGDDCRQDMLCLQLIQLFQNIYKSIGLDLYLFPYKVVATAPGCGVIECVPDSRTRDELGKTAEQSLNLYFINKFGEESSREYQEARRNFVISMAAYSVVGYILQIKDRHNGNIMIDKYGHVIHIDFGFLFESSPGNNLNWEPDFKLTAEFVDLMCAGPGPKSAAANTPGGGTGGVAYSSKIVEPPFYRLFRELVVKGFLAVRTYHEEIVTMVSLMLETGLPCFRGQTIPKLKDRLKLNLSEREARDHILKVINDNSRNIWSKTYDMIQSLQNDIAYF